MRAAALEQLAASIAARASVDGFHIPCRPRERADVVDNTNLDRPQIMVGASNSRLR